MQDRALVPGLARASAGAGCPEELGKNARFSAASHFPPRCALRGARARRPCLLPEPPGTLAGGRFGPLRGPTLARSRIEPVTRAA